MPQLLGWITVLRINMRSLSDRPRFESATSSHVVPVAHSCTELKSTIMAFLISQVASLA